MYLLVFNSGGELSDTIANSCQAYLHYEQIFSVPISVKP